MAICMAMCTARCNASLCLYPFRKTLSYGTVGLILDQGSGQAACKVLCRTSNHIIHKNVLHKNVLHKNVLCIMCLQSFKPFIIYMILMFPGTLDGLRSNSHLVGSSRSVSWERERLLVKCMGIKYYMVRCNLQPQFSLQSR